MSDHRTRAAAYTLTEMLVVLVIIGLLAAVVGPRLFSRLDDARVRTARLQMTSLESAIDIFRIDMGRLPTDEEGLKALIEAPSGESAWLGPYLARNALPADPWGGSYRYQRNETGYAIVSYGSDGKVGGTGTAADITVSSAKDDPRSGAVNADPAPKTDNTPS